MRLREKAKEKSTYNPNTVSILSYFSFSFVFEYTLDFKIQLCFYILATFGPVLLLIILDGILPSFLFSLNYAHFT